jgi:hypothetical protein
VTGEHAVASRSPWSDPAGRVASRSRRGDGRSGPCPETSRRSSPSSRAGTVSAARRLRVLDGCAWLRVGEHVAQEDEILTSFYQAFAPTSFTLLGLWLIVVQTRHAEWRRDPAQRRRTYAITLNFALPGLMSLLSLVDPTSSTIWRVSFAATALGGSVALLLLSRVNRIEDRVDRVAAAASITVVLMYLLMAVIAIHPAVLTGVGITLTALRAEAILLSLLVFVGVNIAWLLMFYDVDD